MLASPAFRATEPYPRPEPMHSSVQLTGQQQPVGRRTRRVGNFSTPATTDRPNLSPINETGSGRLTLHSFELLALIMINFGRTLDS
jgi:hypothetical protein